MMMFKLVSLVTRAMRPHQNLPTLLTAYGGFGKDNLSPPSYYRSPIYSSPCPGHLKDTVDTEQCPGPM